MLTLENPLLLTLSMYNESLSLNVEEFTFWDWIILFPFKLFDENLFFEVTGDGHWVLKSMGILDLFGISALAYSIEARLKSLGNASA